MSSRSSLPSTLPAVCYTSDEFVRYSNEKIYEHGWAFVTIYPSLLKDAGVGIRHSDEHIDPETENRSLKASQFNLGGYQFFALCNVSEEEIDGGSTRADLYYGEYDKLMKDLTETEIADKCEQLDPVKHVVTKAGLIFVTFDKDCTETTEDNVMKWFSGLRELMGPEFTVRNLRIRRRLQYTAKYNFLTFLDGYQECLHCNTTHPGLAKVYPFETYKVEEYGNFCRHTVKPVDDTTADGLFLYFFPGSTFNYYAAGLGMFRVIPIDGSHTKMEFEYYFDNDDPVAFAKYYAFTRQVQKEDLDLCLLTQDNLERGVYKQGCLNPHCENGVVYYQQKIAEKVLAK